MDIGQIGSASKAVTYIDQSASNVVAGAVSKENSAPVITSSAVQKPDAAPPEAQVNQAVKEINTALKNLSPNLEFSVDAESNRTIVKVMDLQTKQVLRQMPSAEAIEISKALDKLQGLLVKQKA